MIQSMTGFGKVTAELPSKKVTVEIKALNSKQLDLSTRIPSIYKEKEMEIRSYLLQALERPAENARRNKVGGSRGG